VAHVLEGIRVLDLTRVVAGPYCTMQLGDLGAEIIKIENPKGGDDSRAYKPPQAAGESTYFMSVNRNKMSVALDFSRPEGREIAQRLARDVDVVVENFSTGVVERHGLDYETVRAFNPEVVYCSISAYGRTGPLADRPGYDPVVQAESGLMSLTGEPEGEPMRTAVAWIDKMTGMYAMQAIMSALFFRERTGKGQKVEVPLFDVGVASTVQYAAHYLMAGDVPVRGGNRSPVAEPTGVFHASDGPIFLAAAGDRTFRKLAEAIGRKDMLELYAENATRLVHRETLRADLAAIFGSMTREELLARLAAFNVPAGAIKTVPEALDGETVRARGLIKDAPHATVANSKVIRSPLLFGASPVREPAGAPTLGQHTDQVLRGIGMDADRIATLRAAGVIA